MGVRYASGGLVKLKTMGSWSFSRWKDYTECPRKAYLSHIAKIKPPADPEDKGQQKLDEGTRIHKLLEDYVKAYRTKKRLPFPKELARLKKELHALLKYNVEAELSITFTKGWEKETYPTDWKNAWVRIKVDLLVLITKNNRVKIIDLKTGVVRDQDREQLKLYAVAALLKFPNAVGADAELWYSGEGIIVDECYSREQLPDLLKIWNKRATKMLSDTTYRPTPGNFCSWCFYASKTKRAKENKAKGGGQCTAA